MLKYTFSVFFFWAIFLSDANSQTSDTVALYFDTAEFELTNKHRQKLDSLYTIWRAKKPAEVKIYGYTDQTGNLPDNKDLSGRRANAVKKYLLKKGSGITDTDIADCRGLGPKMAAAANTADADARFRKAEIIVKYNSGRQNLGNLKSGKTLVIENLDFVPGRHMVTPESEPALENLLELLKQKPTLKIEIQGHICCDPGSDGLDESTGKKELSVNRARFVYNYLIKNGIEAKRLSYRGFGRTKPLVLPERTEADRQKNRRVEIKVVSE